MAYHGNGIKVASGFDVVGKPVDYKDIADTLTEMTAMFQEVGYEGMKVYCKEDRTVYIMRGNDVDSIEPLVNIDLDGDISQALVNYPTKTEVANAYAKKATTLSGYGITNAYTKTETDTAISTHNVNASAHSDIRTLISELAAKLNALANSDDTTLDQMAEVVAYIKDNRGLIEGITTTKANKDYVDSELDKKANSSDLADVATSGKYSDLSGTPTSLPASGGNADTVGGFTVGTNVPADAKFTDTVYTLPNASASAKGGVKIGSNITVSSGTISLTKSNVTSALGYTPPTTDTTYTVGTSSYSGTTKLYTGTGSNTDGTMTQSAITSALDGKLSTSGTAAKATADANGNVIVDTYATQDSLNNYVDLTSDQVINGVKDFGNIACSGIFDLYASTQAQLNGKKIQWKLGTSVAGSISFAQYTGNAASATKATNDSAGNKIVDTYATKADTYTKGEVDSTVDEKIANAVTGGTLDLSGYLTKTEAGNTYATKSAVSSLTTSNIAEGSNLYYTDTRATSNFNTNFTTKSVTGLSDGANVVLDTDTIIINCGNA